jgi:hypothetical protein
MLLYYYACSKSSYGQQHKTADVAMSTVFYAPNFDNDEDNYENFMLKFQQVLF